jgi:hypothetical protein
MNFDDTARFWGSSEKLWPELFVAPSKVATTLCRDCRKVVVEGIRRYCGRCALKRKLASTRESKRAKRGLKGRKTANSLIRAEALMAADTTTRCIDTHRAKKAGFSSAVKGGVV